jgi:CheY-like chemotaxis protein
VHVRDVDGVARRRILCVEDHDDTREMLEELFTFAAYDVVACPTVEAARRRLESGEVFDLVLTDYCLPDGVGTELIELARHGPGAASASPPVVIWSAFPVLDVRGATFIRKPIVDLEHFLDTVRRLATHH